jgi:hypothetical protein
MIYSKINPPVLSPVQSNPFDPVTYISGYYMMAIIPNYELGSTTTSAMTLFGTPIFENELLVRWQTYYLTYVELGEEVMQNWGTNDSIVLYAIAEKTGVQIVEILDTPVSPIFTP